VGNWEADTVGEPEPSDQAVADSLVGDDATRASAIADESASASSVVGSALAPAVAGPKAEVDTAATASAAYDLKPAVALTGDSVARSQDRMPDRPEALQAHLRVSDALGQTVARALPRKEATGVELSQAIADATRRLRDDGGSEPLAVEIESLCERADWVLEHREHLFDQVSALCLELTASLTGLAEDDSWAQGQCEAMRVAVEEGLTARGVKSVSELLRTTRDRQTELRVERDGARQTLKHLINQMLSELGELGSQTGRFHESVGRYADVIERADTLESLAGVVREMVEESRTVQGLVEQTQSRLQDEHRRASEMSERVTLLEAELRRLSDEVSTDQLTQVANRRGLLQAFDTECARMQRVAADVDSGTAPAGLAIGLLDIDNFKRLNDELGHSAGDEALKALAATVSRTLRPSDIVARYGGEEFVVLLPDTPVDEGQQILTRLQRSLTGGLFMHENRQVFVTFSAGVTAYRPAERIEDALERADVALYQAKRAGKNRTLIG
jgi:diguanylate cyclase